jgi:hypothetical protein
MAQELPPSPGAMRADDVRVRRLRDADVGVAEAKRRFGGLDVPATLAGMLCALGLTVLLAGLAAGIGDVGYQRGVRGQDDELSVAGLIGGLVVLLIAFLVGGWVAGRMARYDGARNGLMTAVWFLVLAALVSLLGAWRDEYDFFDRVDLPQWFSDNARGVAAVVSGLVALVVMLLAGLIGGILGARYHRRADDALLNSRSGAIGHGERAAVGQPRIDIRDDHPDRRAAVHEEVRR